MIIPLGRVGNLDHSIVISLINILQDRTKYSNKWIAVLAVKPENMMCPCHNDESEKRKSPACR